MGEKGLDNIPDWVDDKFLTTVIRDIEQDDAVVITDSNITLAVPTGENYMSRMLRIQLEYKRSDESTRQRFFIVKAPPVGEFMKKLMEEGGTFRREIYTFKETFPAMRQLVKEKTLKEPTPISCTAYPCPQPNALVLEDLKPLGFKMADRRAQLDLEHCKVTLRILARFHGMSVALFKKDPCYMEQYKEVTFTEETREVATNITAIPVKEMSEIVATWPGYERFSEKLARVSETCVDRLINIVKPREGKLRVLNHGDIWTNNILFKYSETTGEVIDARLVDFQLCRHSSPAMDLQFFLFTSPRKEVRVQNWNDMLRVYHESLCETLVSLDCQEDVITFEELQDEMEFHSLVGITTSCTLLIVALAEPGSVGLHKLTPEEVGKVNVMAEAQKGERYRKAFQEILHHFEKTGLL